MLSIGSAPKLMLYTDQSLRLTPREGDVVALLGLGLRNKDLARELNITPGTVKVYLSRLYQKLGVTRYELAVYGLRNLVHCETPAKVYELVSPQRY